jgi:hypothetical protein
MEPTVAAVGILTGFFARLLSKSSDHIADRAAQSLFDLVRQAGRGDEQIRRATERLMRDPADRAAAGALSRGLNNAAHAWPGFAHHLDQAVRAASQYTAGPGSFNTVGTGNMMVNNGPGNLSARFTTKHITRNSRTFWLMVGAGVLATMLLLVCGGVGLSVAKDHTTFFDTKTVLSGSDGWRYKVSEAHLHTAPELDGRGAAQPGYKYVFFDITVENLQSDREAPGIEFNFGRSAASLGEDCGAQPTAFFGPVSSYTAGVVAGWCVSKSNDLFGGGSNCYETNDKVIRDVDNIPAGGKNALRCVDSYLVRDGFDLGSLRVYYLGASFYLEGTSRPNLKQIPTST